MKAKTLSLIFILIFSQYLAAQVSPLVQDKQGTFKLLSRSDYASGASFSKSQMAAGLLQIEKLVAIVKRNQVLSSLKGFNAQVRLDDISSVVRCGYGIPVNVEFEFCAFFRNSRGEVVFNTVEPPEWELQVNVLNGSGIPSDSFDMNKCYFSVPVNKRTLMPGVDVYNEDYYVIYDPARPAYWIPVTVSEAFAAAREFASKETDPYTAGLNKEFLDREWSEIPAGDREKQAFYGGGLARVSSTSGYGDAENLFPPLVKVNPDYWNKNRPVSDIQFITFRISNKDDLKYWAESCLRNNCTAYPCMLFELSLDVEFVSSIVSLVRE